MLPRSILGVTSPHRGTIFCCPAWGTPIYKECVAHNLSYNIGIVDSFGDNSIGQQANNN